MVGRLIARRLMMRRLIDGTPRRLRLADPAVTPAAVPAAGGRRRLGREARQT